MGKSPIKTLEMAYLPHISRVQLRVSGHLEVPISRNRHFLEYEIPVPQHHDFVPIFGPLFGPIFGPLFWALFGALNWTPVLGPLVQYLSGMAPRLGPSLSPCPGDPTKGLMRDSTSFR